MPGNQSTHRGPAGLSAVVALVGLPLAAVIWWLARPAPAAPEVVRAIRPAPEIRAAVKTPNPVALPSHVTPPPRAEVASTPPVAPANSGAPHAPGMLPHPITPEHERIFREIGLIGRLDTAMDAKDVPVMRAILKQYRDEYPDDANVMQDGYALIADCLESPGTATRAAAQRHYDERTDSGLRRYIRRYCLE